MSRSAQIADGIHRAAGRVVELRGKDVPAEESDKRLRWLDRRVAAYLVNRLGESGAKRLIDQVEREGRDVF